jgi:Bacterial regulatory proteins, luxR family
MRSGHSAQVWPTLAAATRASRSSDADAVRDQLTRAHNLLATTRRAAAEAAAVTPNAAGWCALAEAECERGRGVARPDLWAKAAAAWERLERPPVAAYCRWRQAEALVAAGASRAQASEPLREAHAVATRIGAKTAAPRAGATRGTGTARARPAGRGVAGWSAGPARDPRPDPARGGGPGLVARGFTNREIAATLVISVRTASVHVSHILRKLGAPNRLEAAAITHGLSAPT